MSFEYIEVTHMRRNKNYCFTKVFFLATGLLMLLFSTQCITEEDFVIAYKNIKEKIVIRQLDELVKHLEEGLFTEEDILNGLRYFYDEEDVIKAFLALQEYKEAINREDGMTLASVDSNIEQPVNLEQNQTLEQLIVSEDSIHVSMTKGEIYKTIGSEFHVNAAAILSDNQYKKLLARDQGRWYTFL